MLRSADWRPNVPEIFFIYALTDTNTARLFRKGEGNDHTNRWHRTTPERIEQLRKIAAQIHPEGFKDEVVSWREGWTWSRYVDGNIR